MTDNTLGERLKKLRLDARASQSELAEWLDGSQHTISDIERGRHEPTLGTLRRYARVFRMSLSDLLEGVD